MADPNRLADIATLDRALRELSPNSPEYHRILVFLQEHPDVAAALHQYRRDFDLNLDGVGGVSPLTPEVSVGGVSPLEPTPNNLTRGQQMFMDWAADAVGSSETAEEWLIPPGSIENPLIPVEPGVNARLQVQPEPGYFASGDNFLPLLSGQQPPVGMPPLPGFVPPSRMADDGGFWPSLEEIAHFALESVPGLLPGYRREYQPPAAEPPGGGIGVLGGGGLPDELMVGPGAGLSAPAPYRGGIITMSPEEMAAETAVETGAPMYVEAQTPGAQNPDLGMPELPQMDEGGSIWDRFFGDSPEAKENLIRFGLTLATGQGAGLGGALRDVALAGLSTLDADKARRRQEYEDARQARLDALDEAELNIRGRSAGAQETQAQAAMLAAQRRNETAETLILGQLTPIWKAAGLSDAEILARSEEVLRGVPMDRPPTSSEAMEKAVELAAEAASKDISLLDADDATINRYLQERAAIFYSMLMQQSGGGAATTPAFSVGLDEL